MDKHELIYQHLKAKQLLRDNQVTSASNSAKETMIFSATHPVHPGERAALITVRLQPNRSPVRTAQFDVGIDFLKKRVKVYRYKLNRPPIAHVGRSVNGTPTTTDPDLLDRELLRVLIDVAPK